MFIFIFDHILALVFEYVWVFQRRETQIESNKILHHMSSFCEDVSFEEVLVPIGVGGESHRSSSAISEFPTSKASSFIDACRGGALIIGEGPGFEAASTWASVKLKGYPGVTCQYFYFSEWFSRIPRCEISQVPRRWLKSFLRRSLKQWSLWRVKVEKSAA